MPRTTPPPWCARRRVWHVETAATVSRDWLSCAGVPRHAQEAIVAEVQERLADLPSLLRWGATGADRVLGVLPDRMLAAAVRVPGCSEWARLVTGLTAVAYYERAGAGRVPGQRTHSPSVDIFA